ncbi:MAG: glycosyltransferase family 2 protein [Candidatus Sumerlaeota bacterium]|nr:glycosyltransferase family 2 protein [Candidatus Sumerlaeota bacterium]
MPQPRLISVIIITLNGADVIDGCLRSLLANEGPRFEILVVDNGSTDSTARLVGERFPQARLIHLPRNLGFAGGANVGIQASRGEIVVLLNDDTICAPDLLVELARPLLDDPAIGVVGAKIYYPDGRTLQHAGGEIAANALTRHIGYEEIDRGQHDAPRDVDYVSGCCMAVRRDVFRRIGLLDPQYFPIYFEEVELCVRARKAGWRVITAPRATLRHLESKTQVRFSPRFNYRYNRGRLRFMLKNFSGREILRALRREGSWLLSGARWRTRGYVATLFRVYATTLLRLPSILYDRNHRIVRLRDETPRP